MASISDFRRDLRAAAEPLLDEGELVQVSAAPSEYGAGLNTLRFTVTITVGPPETSTERLDDLLEPIAGIKTALEDAGFTVSKSSGYRTFQSPDGPLLGAEWTAETLT